MKLAVFTRNRGARLSALIAGSFFGVKYATMILIGISAISMRSIGKRWREYSVASVGSFKK